ncbi:S-methyl-5'-thioinosine phosphorylase [Sinimarinibacterium sp. CAU 1509]|uniref:S-methyl-5'-thioinosine phosphorylase n=1 Tax=Sinimarinibacterium sp. CAU 1509 TaxID=2562283 RepID=UPI0010AD7AB2|nr:S-methyl-5'-thioinosine phosphorylase [Sinimarinibacterium sp. CAU 1509]TJY63054.1 S-methyl-5'-thioinosine phosphorylase [Sinimarinibacterium sp. CAU 1509]
MNEQGANTQRAAARVAVIGGTGMNQWPGLQVIAQHAAQTPYGAPSAPLLDGMLDATPAIFLARHGEGHKIPPHAINYRANLRALADAGVRSVIAIAAVGGIADWFAPGEIAIPYDLIDYTWGREHTYSDGSEGAPLDHVEFTQPYAPALRSVLLDTARASATRIAGQGVMAVTQGPRLESAAEVRRMQRDGADMIGMTGMPEAALARELGLNYACIAVSVNWAAGVKGLGNIHAEIEQSIENGMSKVRALLTAALPEIHSESV